MKPNHKIIQEVCSAISRNAIGEAKAVLTQKYAFSVSVSNERRYSDCQKIRVFLRDGFVDRYSGQKLVFPGVLRLLSSLMPEEFPFHKNWKMSQCHIAYWHLFPTIDHVVPIARGGKDDESNWVCTSQLKNSAKSNWLLEELGWELHEAGRSEEWDGLLSWFMEYVAGNPRALDDSYLLSWYRAAKQVYET